LIFLELRLFPKNPDSSSLEFVWPDSILRSFSSNLDSDSRLLAEEFTPFPACSGFAAQTALGEKVVVSTGIAAGAFQARDEVCVLDGLLFESQAELFK